MPARTAAATGRTLVGVRLISMCMNVSIAGNATATPAPAATARVIVPIAKAKSAILMVESRSHERIVTDEFCANHPHETCVGACCSCQSAFCASCAVAYPGQQEPALCLDCGVALLLKWWHRALGFAFFGALFGWWLLVQLRLPHKSIWLMTTTCGYGSWAMFYGWQSSARIWNRCYNVLRRALGRPWSTLAILALLRIPGALLFGACGGGLRVCLHTFVLLRKRRRLFEA